MIDHWEPDIGKGVFETLLVVAGEPVELEAHLRRLARSLQSLYLLALPEDAGERLETAAEDLGLGRLRLTAVPPSDFRGQMSELIAEVSIDAKEIDPGLILPKRGVRLRTRAVRGGLGSHKWAYRPGINRPGTGEAGALIVDEGKVLEAGWANVFAVRGSTLFTPPLDGRLLPGITRAALLALASREKIETREQPITPEDLLHSDEVFLTGSIRGIEPALELDGQPLAGRGPLSYRLAGALRQRWGLLSEKDALQAAATAPRPDLPSR